MADMEKVIEDLGTAIMCVNNLLTQEQFIVRDKVVNAMIEAIKLIEEQDKQKPLLPYNMDKVGGNCPVCGLRMARGHNYCYQCGQKLNWGE